MAKCRDEREILRVDFFSQTVLMLERFRFIKDVQHS